MAAEIEKDKRASKGQAWFCASGLPSDIVVEVQDMTFHLHKFPLIAKSRKLHNLITEQENQTLEPPEQDQSQGGEIEQVRAFITLPDFPGGSDTFEAAAKFCYGVKIDLNASTAAPIRCAAEYLEMTDDYCEDNLVSKTELYLTTSVFKSLKNSAKALKSCEKVTHLAETLGILGKCIDSVSSRASSSDPAALFGWPVTRDGGDSRNQALWNGIESAIRPRAAKGSGSESSWLEHVAGLSLPLFKRLILAMRNKNVSPEIIESCLMNYARRNIPGISRSSRTKPSTSNAASTSSSIASESEQREVLEVVITNLPIERRSSSSASRSPAVIRFLFGLLRTANILNAPEPIRATLERKVGSQLDQATLDDLLIPSYSYLNETLYDVDCVERILGYFLDGIEEGRRRRTSITASGGIEEDEGEEDGGGERNADKSPLLILVGKLIDGYLAEIASDANLKPDRFYNLAISLPERARLFDDGLYRAVDVYLKAHSWITEGERERICGVIDCQKLTLEACTHASQNERLPLRAVVQVLFFEQLQLRHAIAGTLIAADAGQPVLEAGGPSGARAEEEEENGAGREGSNSTWREAVRENQVLRLDMDSMRTRVHQLERECSTMKKVIEKIDKEGAAPRGWRGSFTRKFGCKFKTQVCDSHEQTVVNASKARNNNHHHRHHHHPQHQHED